MVKCMICNKIFKNYAGIGKHIRKHKICSKEYYDRYLRNYMQDEGFCLECGKETKYIDLNNGYQRYCSVKCRANNKVYKENYKKSIIKKYGVEHPWHSREILKKKKDTFFKKYGVENPWKSTKVREKIKQTCLEKYGAENPSQSEEIKEKTKRTCLERYGVENPWKSTKVREKIKQTCLDKYGVENPSQSKEFKEKIKKTYLEKYGVEHHFKSEKTKRKLRNSGIIGHKDGKPLFDFHAPKIDWVEEVRRSTKDNDILEVRCKKCNKWFIPKIINLYNREQSLNGNRDTVENNLYCSNECKNSCSIFGKRLYQEGQNPNSERPYHQEWSREVKRIANYECEICGSKFNLTAHHIQPVKLRPDLQADIDNGVCLCRICHSKYGHNDECSTGNLAKRIC